MWSPKQNNNGSYSQYYANMTLVEPGDLVLSYAGAKIRAIGVAVSAAYESPKPVEFGVAGATWADLGWRVDVNFIELPDEGTISPKDYRDELLPLRPDKYSPITSTGDGFTAYLFEMPRPFADTVLSKIDSPAEWSILRQLQESDENLRRLGEDRVEDFLKLAPIEETERRALIAARRGQGRFRQGVSRLEPACRFTGVRTPELLVASHIRPWHRCHTNEERLDPFNGLMLTPTFDRLFDRGLISFSSESRLLTSSHLRRDDIRRVHLDPETALAPFRSRQQEYLEYHREHVFRR